MEDSTEIFVFASPEIEQLLADYQTDVVELLKRQDIDVRYGVASDPAVTGFQEKSAPKVIIASAALTLSLTPLLSQAIQSITPRGIVVHEVICIPVEDSQGNVVRDASGEPVLQWVRRDKLHEFSQQINRTSQVSLKGFGLEVKYSDSSGETPPQQ
ncbi:MULTISPECIES: hypothetical protein [Leptolyngbya]|uniref:hypothetical protein n=1 Tax=Leptolyngbya TaxID=47251 RepID=UPI001687FCA1|nr:hypothetical protein [Leptolyngbya sp. FACHB-1624]MBD1858589.1 hypothetical protein [Leptolyngbya sp. FACHB-1624]